MSSKTVLVTGANGYLGSAVLLHFLERGYTVRGTVRSLDKADGVKAYLLPKYASSLSFVVIEDMTKDGVYEQAGALDGVDAICHVASPVPDLESLGPAAPGADVDWVRDIVEPAIQGTLAILHAASKSPQVTHVAITSSVAAVLGLTDIAQRTPQSRLLTDAEWNSARKDDEANHTNAFAAYFAAKTEAELAAWRYVEEERPHYTVATFCPPFFFGPQAVKVSKGKELRSSLSLFYMLMQGQDSPVPLNDNFIDVRDIAEAFRLTFETPLKEHQRFLLAAGFTTQEELVAFAKTLDPSPLQDMPAGLDVTKAKQLLGWKPRGKKETFVDMAAYLKEQEKGFSA